MILAIQGKNKRASYSKWFILCIFKLLLFINLDVRLKLRLAIWGIWWTIVIRVRLKCIGGIDKRVEKCRSIWKEKIKEIEKEIAAS